MAGRLLAEWVSPPAPGGGAGTIDKPDPENFWEGVGIDQTGWPRKTQVHSSLH